MPLTLDVDDITTPGAQSLIFAARDELDRRYGVGADAEMPDSELAAPGGLFVVARLDSHLAGGVGVRTIVAPGSGIGEIKRLWVRPDLRRSGVAAALMAHVERAAADAGFVELYLETGPRQPEAQAFYARIGWTPVTAFPPGAHAYPDGIKFYRDLRL